MNLQPANLLIVFMVDTKKFMRTTSILSSGNCSSFGSNEAKNYKILFPSMFDLKRKVSYSSCVEIG